MTDSYGIIFQNKHWLICDKPCGWLSVPSRTGAADPRKVLGLELEKLLGLRIWPVHRLDCEVSGLLLFALNANAHRLANRWFENHDIRKTYEAWSHPVAGVVANMQEEWRCLLVRGKKRAFEADYGKEAITLAQATGRIIYNEHDCQRWELMPLTGRSHQLRYELAKHASPIIGDQLYGSKCAFIADGIALRAIRLDFRSCSEADALGLPPIIEAPGLSALLTSEA